MAQFARFNDGGFVLLAAMIEWKDAKTTNTKHKAVKVSVGYVYTETLVK